MRRRARSPRLPAPRPVSRRLPDHPRYREFSDDHSCRCWVRSLWEFDYDLGSLADLALDEKTSPVRFDYPLDDIETKTSSAGSFAVLAAVIGSADPRQFVLSDAASIIGNRDSVRGTISLDADPNRSVFRRILDAVDDDVLEHLTKQHLVAIHYLGLGT